MTTFAAESGGTLLPAYREWAEVPADIPYYLNSLTDPVRNRLYVVTHQKLAVYDTEQRQHLGEVVLDNNQLGLIAIGRDGRRVYLSGHPDYDTSATIQAIDTAALTLGPTFSIPCVPGNGCHITSIATGPGNRLYVMIDTTPGFRVVDGASGQVLRTITHSADGNVGGLATAGNKLYLIDTPVGETQTLYRYDISGIDPVLEDAKLIAGIDAWGSSVSLSVSPDGSLLLRSETGTGVDVFDANTLGVVASRINEYYDFAGLPGTWFKSATFASDGEVLAAVSTDAKVVMLALTSDTLEPVRKANRSVSDYAHGGIAGLANRNVAHIYADKITFQAPSDYAAAVPLTMANHCGSGQITDTFDDPTSGWPIDDNGRTVVGYTDGNYQILQREPNRLTAVTRGDYWNNGEEYRVDGWFKSGDQGSYGIIFGLNNDWSEFYTLEVYPDKRIKYRTVVVLHYTDKDGWELVNVQYEMYSVNPGTELNQFRMYPTQDGMGHEVLGVFVNSQTAAHLPVDLVGRVGLIAASPPDSGAEARFDDYFFSGQNCWYADHSGSLMASTMLIERPSLDELRQAFDGIRPATAGLDWPATRTDNP